MTLWNLNSFSSHLHWCGPLHLVFPGNVAYASTNIPQVTYEEEEDSIYWHMTMQGCGLTSLVICINDRICDIRERNVTIKSEIWSRNICSLGVGDIREWVILWKVILRSLGCIWKSEMSAFPKSTINLGRWSSTPGGFKQASKSQTRNPDLQTQNLLVIWAEPSTQLSTHARACAFCTDSK